MKPENLVFTPLWHHRQLTDSALMRCSSGQYLICIELFQRKSGKFFGVGKVTEEKMLNLGIKIFLTWQRTNMISVLNPDGPHGPAYVLKKGILHLSLKSCVPVVAVRFSSSRFRELKTWDRKKFVYPFSTIEMKIGEPIRVTDDNFEYAHDLIEREME